MGHANYTGRRLKLARRKNRCYLKRGLQKLTHLKNSEILVKNKNGNFIRVKPIRIIESPANNSYKARGILVKSTVVETSLGLVCVSSKTKNLPIYGILKS